MSRTNYQGSGPIGMALAGITLVAAFLWASVPVSWAASNTPAARSYTPLADAPLAETPLAASLGQDQAPVTLEQAVMTAVAAIPGRAVEAQLSADEGRVVYEVEIIDRAQDRRRVYVDAEGGKVIKVRATPFRP
jgi:peptidase YpeB-like protein